MPTIVMERPYFDTSLLALRNSRKQAIVVIIVLVLSAAAFSTYYFAFHRLKVSWWIFVLFVCYGIIIIMQVVKLARIQKEINQVRGRATRVACPAPNAPINDPPPDFPPLYEEINNCEVIDSNVSPDILRQNQLILQQQEQQRQQQREEEQQQVQEFSQPETTINIDDPSSTEATSQDQMRLSAISRRPAIPNPKFMTNESDPAHYRQLVMSLGFEEVETVKDRVVEEYCHKNRKPLTCSQVCNILAFFSDNYSYKKFIKHLYPVVSDKENFESQILNVFLNDYDRSQLKQELNL